MYHFYDQNRVLDRYFTTYESAAKAFEGFLLELHDGGWKVTLQEGVTPESPKRCGGYKSQLVIVRQAYGESNVTLGDFGDLNLYLIQPES